MQKDYVASGVFMVRPTSFGFDEQTAQTNAFQHHLEASQVAITKKAIDEFDAYVQTLKSNGIDVVVFDDSPTPPKPNAVFPNNWLSTWRDGSVVLYPMATESRRRERTDTALDALRRSYAVQTVEDISDAELRGEYLEGTGAIVFDHRNKIAYACISARCDAGLFDRHVTELGYRPLAFCAYDQAGTAIYHTNVLMGVQRTTAVLCAEAITDAQERERVLSELQATGHDVVGITLEQMAHFCGNVIEIQNRQGEHFLLLSQTAYDAFTPDQRIQLSRDKTLLPIAIPTIETIGGGSARCMVAELFLPAQ